MPFGRYLALTAAGSLAWNALLITLGRRLGDRWGSVSSIVGPIAQVVVVICVPLTLGWLILWRRRRALAA